MQRKYKPLQFTSLNRQHYSLVVVRDEDKHVIRQWRNEQIDILRQNKILSEAEQNEYFKNTIDELFNEEKPKQLIFSFLASGKLIGYGGLVHIDWGKKSAEISFLTATERSRIPDLFIEDWNNYLEIIKQVADEYLNFNSIFTYAYDIRPNLYVALEKSGFKETQRYSGNVEINGVWKDSVVHTFYFNAIHMRKATKEDVDVYFRWTNDPLVRAFSFNQDKIEYANHVNWFLSRVENEKYAFYFFETTKNEPVGQVRIETTETEVIIGVSIDGAHRGSGYGSKMLKIACENYFKNTNCETIVAYIKEENLPSQAIFKKAGFTSDESSQLKSNGSLRLILKNEKL